jgi:hypothetical protein
MKKLKQGQTVYWIDWDYQHNPPNPKVTAMFLHSQKTPLPEEGYVIEKWPVAFVAALARKWGSSWLYPSRRKAVTALKALIRK